MNRSLLVTLRLTLSAYLATIILFGLLYAWSYMVYNPWMFEEGVRSHFDLLPSLLFNLIEYGTYLLSALALLTLSTTFLWERKRTRFGARALALLAVSTYFGFSDLIMFYESPARAQFGTFGHFSHYAVIWSEEHFSQWPNIYVPAFMRSIALFLTPQLALLLFEAPEFGRPSHHGVSKS